MTAPHRPTLWPTTPLQQGLLALAELHQDPDAYIGQAVVDIVGPLDAAALERAIGAVTADHPHLHAGLLLSEQTTPLQFIDTQLPPVVEFHSISVDQVVQMQRSLAWSLDEPPLIRWDVTEVEDQRAFVVGAHHAVLDGWSMPLLVAQIARAYALALGEPTDIPASQADYPALLAHVTGRNASSSHAFWAEHLAHVRHLPIHPGADLLSKAGPRERRRPARLVHRIPRLATFAASASVTPAALARTCWGLALDALTGVSGTPYAVAVSTRDPEIPGSGDVIGLATEAVLVADRPEPASTVRHAAEAGQRRWLDTLAHRHVGLRGIHAALERGEIATSLLAVENVPAQTAYAAGPLTFVLRQVEDDTHYALAPTVRVHDDGSWTFELLVDAARVTQSTARRLADAFLAFVEAASAEVSIAQVDILGEADRALVIRAESRREAQADSIHRAPLLPDVLAQTCRRHHERVAVVGAGPRHRSTVTFAALADRIARAGDDLLAHVPIGHGERPGLVGVSRTRSVSTVVTMLAALDVGATLMVLDPALPASRRDDILADTSADVLVTDDGIRALRGGSTGAFRRTPRPGDVATIMLTSGSTGLPKPVAVPHHALAALLARHTDALHPDGATRPRQIGHSAALHFDAHWDALLALYRGHTVHLLADDLYLDAFALAEYAQASQLDYLDLTPTVWSALLAAEAFTDLPRTCVLGGEAVPATLWTDLARRAEHTDTRVLNVYGPTETTVDAAWAQVVDHPTPVVGGPVGASGLLVLDACLRRVPPGVTGELYVTGPQVAHGYLNRPDVTAARFVANPYSRIDATGRPVPGDERMYRTGDLATWTEAGLVRLGGRSDHQMSIAGRRVEPGEIESVVQRDSRVAQAAVVLAASRSGRGRLIAHVVLADRGVDGPSEPTRLDPDTAASLGEYAATHLPASLLPADFVAWPALPRTTNGKLDRAALANVWCLQTSGAAAAGAGPLGSGTVPLAAYADVCAAVAAVLGIDVGVLAPEADFFTAGGDSIAAIHVATRLRESGWQIRASDVLTGRTPAGIAALAVPSDRVLAAPSSAAKNRNALDPFELLDARARQELGARIDLERVLPLSPTQLGMYIDAHRIDPDPYRTTLTLRIVDPAATVSQIEVEAAVQAWFVEHEVLRMGVWQGHLDRPVAVIPRHIGVPHEVLDMIGRAPADVEALLDGARAQERLRAYSFEDARLAGYTWVRVSTTESYLVIGMHHVLIDGWSTPLLVAELEAALRGNGASAAHAGTERGFEEYQRWWQAQDHEHADEVWRREFANPVSSVLARGPAGGDGRAVATAVIPAVRVHGIAARGTTLAAAAQAAWARVLTGLTGRTDVAYLLASSGRPEECRGIESAVGMFVTTRPVRVDTNRPTDRLVGDVVEFTTRTDTAAHLGLGRITQLIGQVADSLVVVENYPRPHNAQAPGLVRVDPVSGEDSTTYPVAATVMVGDETHLEIEVVPEACPVSADALVRLWADELEAVATGSAGLSATTAAGERVEAVVAAVATTSVPPRAEKNDDVQLVAQVMAQVLGVDDMDAGTSFFDAGGDSISAVSLVGSLRHAGAVVSIGDVFSAPAPRDLAGRIGIDQYATSRPAGATGRFGQAELFLTPALAWYRELLGRGPGQGMQQLREFRLPGDTPVTAIGAAIAELMSRHDALRIALDEHRAEIVPPENGFITVVDTSQVEAELRRATTEIDPLRGDLVRWIVTRTDEAARVVALAHHLAVDAVTWGVLETELSRLVAGQPLADPPSFAEWSAVQASCVPRAAASLPQWRRALAPADPLVAPASELGRVGQGREFDVTLPVDVTEGLLATGVRMEVLLAAALTGGRAGDLVIEMEGHGRPTEVAETDPRFGHPGIDAAGWFTATWPVRLPGAAGPAEHRHAHVARTRAAIDLHRSCGDDYGLLRYLDPSHRAELTAREKDSPPQVLLNYLGTSVRSDGVDPAVLESALGLHAQVPVSHPLELSAQVVRTDTGPVLAARWQAAGPATGEAEAVVAAWTEQLARLANMGRLPDHLQVALPLHDAAGLAAHERAQITCDPTVQAVWEPTPVQRGMVFHAAEGDPYTSSLRIEMTGDLDVETLRRAVIDVVADSPQLRLRVRWIGEGGGRRPVLVTVAGADVEWLTTDRDALGARVRVADLVRRRYALEQDPLLRVAVVQAGEGRHEMVIANHHLLLDGWSMPLLIEAILTRYAAIRHGRAPSAGAVPVAASPFARRTDRLAIAFETGARTAIDRRRELLSGAAAGLTVPALIERFGTPAARSSERIDVRETVRGTSALESSARRRGTTVAALVATAWGLTLAAATGSDSAVTGLVISGRDGHPEDAGMIGMFTDTVPLLVRTQTEPSAASLLQDVTAQIGALLVEPPVGLASLGRALGRGEVLDTLLVVENYPVPDKADPGTGLSVAVVDAHDATHYPLGLTVESEDERTRLRLETDPNLIGADLADGLHAAITAMLDLLGSGDDAETVRDLTDAALAALPAVSAEAVTNGGDAEVVGVAGVVVDTLVGVFAGLFLDEDEAVTADANFFSLGGDSILAMTLVAHCRARGLRVRPSDVFAAPTPRTLAGRVTADGADRSAAGSDTTPPTGPHNTDIAATGTDLGTGFFTLDASGAAALDDLLRSL